MLHCRKRKGLDLDVFKSLPKELEKRAINLIAKSVAQFVWRHQVKIRMPAPATDSIRTIYDYLRAGRPWEVYIGHLVPRVPALYSGGDSSLHALGIVAPSICVFSCMPFSNGIMARLRLDSKHPSFLHINSAEFIAFMLSCIVHKMLVTAHPEQFPPVPILHADCDNTSAVSWAHKLTSRSSQAQGLLRLYAEFLLESPLGNYPRHLAGTLNVMPDTVSRPSELYSPNLDSPSDRSFRSHISQIIQRLPELASWKVFLPSPELLSLFRSALSSSAISDRPLVPETLGQFVDVESILSGSHTSFNSCHPFSL